MNAEQLRCECGLCEGWKCAARLLADDTKIRRLVWAKGHETTVQAVERYIAELEDAGREMAEAAEP